MPHDNNSQAQFDNDIARKLDEIIRALDLLSDIQDNQVKDDAAQFSRLQKRLDRMEKQLSKLADATDDDSAKDVEYDWRAHKAQVLAQYGIDEPLDRSPTKTEPATAEPAVNAATNSQPLHDVTTHSEMELNEEQADQIEQLKNELRAKIRQAEVDLSIKHAKLEQQEARIEEKQAELDRMSRALESQNQTRETEQSPGVLGRLKRQLNIIARIRGRGKEPENRNEKFLDALKKTGSPKPESETEVEELPVEQLEQTKTLAAELSSGHTSENEPSENTDDQRTALAVNPEPTLENAQPDSEPEVQAKSFPDSEVEPAEILLNSDTNRPSLPSKEEERNEESFESTTALESPAPTTESSTESLPKPIAEATTDSDVASNEHIDDAKSDECQTPADDELPKICFEEKSEQAEQAADAETESATSESIIAELSKLAELTAEIKKENEERQAESAEPEQCESPDTESLNEVASSADTLSRDADPEPTQVAVKSQPKNQAKPAAKSRRAKRRRKNKRRRK